MGAADNLLVLLILGSMLAWGYMAWRRISLKDLMLEIREGAAELPELTQTQ